MKVVSALLILLVWDHGATADTAETAEENRNATVPKPTILHFHVHSDIKLRYARTVINTKIRNIENISQEVTFDAVLPERAFISEFQMVIDGVVYNAYVQEKEKAKQEYAEAVKSGRTAAHVALSARDSQRLEVSLNVEAEKKVTFILTYEELLNRKLGSYRHIINLDPGEVVEDFRVVVRITEVNNITKLVVPPLITSNEISGDAEDSTNTLATVERPTPQTAVVRFTPTSQQQCELNSEGVMGQFMVEYDVDRSNKSGEVLMNDGYFVHFFAPEDLPPLRKHVSFVLDVSGSMAGRKIEQLKQAMTSILDQLKSDDLFSIVVFSSNVQVWDYNMSRAFMYERIERLQGMRWGDYDVDEEEAERLNRHVIAEATPENILSAKTFIELLGPVGATNINDAVLKGLELSKLAISRHNLSSVNNSVQENNELQEIDAEEPATVQKPLPILIFLTDGKANVGVSNLIAINNNVKRANTGNCSVYSLALGSEADFDFLKKLSLRNSGFARRIYEAADTALQLTDFYRQVSTPLLSQITFRYQPEQVVKDTLTKLKHRLLFSGSEIVVAGKVKHETFSGEVRGLSKTGNSTYEFTPSNFSSLSHDTNTTTSFMERLWAYLTVTQLLEKKQISSDDNNSNESDNDSDEGSDETDGTNNQTALELALKYSFVTPLTSLVVVKPNETNSVGTEDASDSGVQTRSGGVQRMAPARGNNPSALFSSGSAGDKTRGWHQVFSESAVVPPRRHALANLSDVTWLEALTSNNTVTLTTGVNATAEVLQLAGDDQRNAVYNACSIPGNLNGHCRHFKFCVLTAFTNSQEDFLPYLCRIDNFLGVCCPDYLQPGGS